MEEGVIVECIVTGDCKDLLKKKKNKILEVINHLSIKLISIQTFSKIPKSVQLFIKAKQIFSPE
jgi:hypothetical protein